MSKFRRATQNKVNDWSNREASYLNKAYSHRPDYTSESQLGGLPLRRKIYEIDTTHNYSIEDKMSEFVLAAEDLYGDIRVLLSFGDASDSDRLALETAAELIERAQDVLKGNALGMEI